LLNHSHLTFGPNRIFHATCWPLEFQFVESSQVSEFPPEKPAHPGDKNRRATGLNPQFPPTKERFPSLCLASHRSGSLIYDGGILLTS
jgi:hypothetical protein